MDQQKLQIKQLSLTIFEKILLEKEYSSKEEILLKAVKLCKESRIKNAPKTMLLAQDGALKMIKNMDFNEIQEIVAILKKK